LNERQTLYEKYKDIIEVNPELNRQLVSGRNNKKYPFYRWFNFKESFSRDLVHYFMDKYCSKEGTVFDPFAGIGTALYAAAEKGWSAVGTDIMPFGVFWNEVYGSVADFQYNKNEILEIADLIKNTPMRPYFDELHFYSPIVCGAFPTDSMNGINLVLKTLKNTKMAPSTRLFFRALLMNILEDISYTSKDGGYLRWDHRARRTKSTYEKTIIPFLDVFVAQFGIMYEDIDKLPVSGNTLLYQRSNFEFLVTSKENTYDCVITSPPYCNRYDYTRTYALELVYLGYGDREIKDLRQALLSATVENKDKVEHLKTLYKHYDKMDDFNRVEEVYHNSKAMFEVNSILGGMAKNKELNNSNIARMVQNYLYEMCFVIHGLHKVLKKNSSCIMVNDNVQYNNEEIPIDLMLSSFAESFGFKIEKIYVLPRGKGNSSQQMAKYGRTELRKCVYVWRKN